MQCHRSLASNFFSLSISSTDVLGGRFNLISNWILLDCFYRIIDAKGYKQTRVGLNAHIGFLILFVNRFLSCMIRRDNTNYGGIRWDIGADDWAAREPRVVYSIDKERFTSAIAERRDNSMFDQWLWESTVQGVPVHRKAVREANKENFL